ncbi:hypothetical protein PCASD_03449 [Puccinia coronata f. sp. avenae]|uniref:Mid2 domain-containing protein n=1 Tax=Puccinia coronata f. sp. avenae TaxID=200324 RepID=A0A2N5VF73_9BASI|nr:hypothetical protein PCASD_03449 [Puccinia coronata f. sp. avenae]
MKTSTTTLLNALLLLSLAVSLIHSQVNNAISSAPTAAAATPTSSASTSEATAQPTETSTASTSAATPTNLPTSSVVSSSSSPINSASNSGVSSTSLTSASSRSSQASSSTSGTTSQASSSVVIITVTRTGSDGQVYTSVSSSYTPLPRATGSPSSNSSGGSSSSSNTWAIIGGIVGGLAGIGAVVFIVFRCTQRRFSDLDDEDVAIKWPELVNRAEDPTTLNPLAARPGVGHGVGEDDVDEKPRLYSHDIAMESLHSDQRHPGMFDTYQAYPPPPPALHAQEHAGYYDPYLGPSAAQQPYPGMLSNLGYDEQPGYSPQQSQQQQRGHDLQSQPSLTSSVGQDSSSLTSPTNSRHQQQHLHHNMSFSDTHQQQQQQQQQQQYPIAWDGPEDIPLTVKP